MPALQIRLNSAHLWLPWGVLIAQLFFVCMTFPVTQLFTKSPLLYIDSPFHWYEIEVAKGLAAQGRLVGYDPFFAAGYVGGVAFNASAKFPALLAIILEPWLSTVVVYKLYVFCAAVLGPVCVPLAGRWLGLSGRASFAATMFATLLWWLSALRWFHTAGTVSFVFAAYLGLPYVALILRYLREGTRWPVAFALAGTGAVGMFLHPLFPVLVAPFALALTLAHWRKCNSRRLVIVYAIVPALSLLPNLTWILPTLHYPSFANSDMSPYQKAVNISIIWNEALGQITATGRGSRLNLVLWFAVCCALAVRSEPDARRTGVAATATSAFLILFAAVGAWLPFAGTLQPNRFSSAAYLYLSIPAGLGVAAVFERLPSSKGLLRGALVGSAGLFVVALTFLGRELARELSRSDIPHHGQQPPEVRGVGPISAWLINWLQRNTSADARILFESSKGRIYDQAHMAGFYALAADREFVGGPYPFMHFAGYWDDHLFGRPIESFSEQDFADYFYRYNIGWIVAFSEASKQVLDRLPEVTPRERFGPIQTYTVTGPHSFFLDGSGTLAGRSFNRIELADLSGTSVVLKYHYVTGLRSIPAVRIEPVSVPDDSEPFIRIVDPPPRLLLYMHK